MCSLLVIGRQHSLYLCINIKIYLFPVRYHSFSKVYYLPNLNRRYFLYMLVWLMLNNLEFYSKDVNGVNAGLEHTCKWHLCFQK